jgi:hypothetical protein
MRDEIRNDRRTRTSLGQRIAATSDLRQDGCNRIAQLEIAVFDKETANSPKIDRREKILQVDIENPSPMAVLPCVREDRPFALESVCSSISNLLSFVYFVEAILQQVGEVSLQLLQAGNWRVDGALPAAPFGNIKRGVLFIQWQYVQKV